MATDNPKESLDQDYSQLEVASSEHVHQSPELVNYSTFGPEATSIPQDAAHSSYAGPQRSSSHVSPELVQEKWRPQSPAAFDTSGLIKSDSKTGDNNDPQSTPTQPEKEAIDQPRRKESLFRKRGILFWVGVGLVALIAIVIGIGVGVGVGLRNHKSAAPSPSATTPVLPSDTTLPHGLFNDTSLSVIALSNGDKRLFFQETSGIIREALYTSSTGQWTADVNNIVAVDAKNSTPLTACEVNNSGSSSSLGTRILLLYISKNNTLASRQFLSGTWASRDNFSPSSAGNISFDAEPDSRALAVTSQANQTEYGGAYVFYVASNGSAVCLSMIMDSDSVNAKPGPVLPPSLNGGHILALAAGEPSVGRSQVGALTSNGTVYYSLFFSFLDNGSWTQPELQTVLVPPLPAGQRVNIPSTLTLNDAYPATTTMSQGAPIATMDPSLQTAAYNESLIGDLNIAQVFINTGSSRNYTLFGFWVNGTTLAAYTTKNIGLSTKPQSSFPFSRLAGTTVGNSSDVYLYHQMNQTAFAEDTYNTDGGFFTSKSFNIATD